MEQKEFNELMDAQKSNIVKEVTEKAAEIAESKINSVSVKMDEIDNRIKGIDAHLAEQKKFNQSAEQTESLDAQLKKSADVLTNMKSNRSANVSFDTKAVATMTTANYTGGIIGISQMQPGVEGFVRRQPFLRQLVNVLPLATQNAVWAELQNPEGGAGNTAEGAVKSQYDFEYVEKSAKAEKITVYTKASKEALDDIASLSSIIRSELVDLLELKLDGDIYSGTGVSPVIKGILPYAQSFSVAGTSLALGVDQANHFDVIRAAAWQVQKENFVADYVLVNPIDAAMMDLAKGTDGHYALPPYITAGGQTIAGLKVVVNNGVTAGDFLVGDFKKSNLAIREGITVSIGYENDDFTKNLVTILAESRAAHFVKSQHVKAFVKGTFATAKAALETA